MRFCVTNIFVDNDILLFRFGLHNRSQIGYTIDFIRFYIQDAKNGKRPPSSSWSSSPSSLSTVRRRWLRFPHVTLRSPFRNSPYRTRRCSS